MDLFCQNYRPLSVKLATSCCCISSSFPLMLFKLPKYCNFATTSRVSFFFFFFFGGGGGGGEGHDWAVCKSV